MGYGEEEGRQETLGFKAPWAGILLSLGLFSSYTWPYLPHQLCSLSKQVSLRSVSWFCSKVQVPGVLKDDQPHTRAGFDAGFVVRTYVSTTELSAFEVLQAGDAALPPSSWSAVVSLHCLTQGASA